MTSPEPPSDFKITLRYKPGMGMLYYLIFTSLFYTSYIFYDIHKQTDSFQFPFALITKVLLISGILAVGSGAVTVFGIRYLGKIELKGNSIIKVFMGRRLAVLDWAGLETYPMRCFLGQPGLLICNGKHCIWIRSSFDNYKQAIELFMSRGYLPSEPIKYVTWREFAKAQPQKAKLKFFFS